MVSLYFRILSVQHAYLLMTSYCTFFGENPNRFSRQERRSSWAFSTWEFWYLIESGGFSCYISFSLLYPLFFTLEMRVIAILGVENFCDTSPYPQSAWCYFPLKLCIVFWTDKWLGWHGSSKGINGETTRINLSFFFFRTSQFTPLTLKNWFTLIYH